MLTFITYPAWWTAADVRPFLLSWAGDGIPPFVEIGRPGSVLSDFLPGVEAGVRSTVDVFTNVRSQPLQPSDSFVPHAGALVLTMPSHDGDPAVVHAQDVVSDPTNAFEPGGQYPQWPDGNACTLLLGLMFEQILVKHDGGALEAELAQHTMSLQLTLWCTIRVLLLMMWRSKGTLCSTLQRLGDGHSMAEHSEELGSSLIPETWASPFASGSSTAERS